MNHEQMYNMLAIFNPDETVWFYLIKPGSRHVVLLILDDRGFELARKEFGSHPSDWDMHSPAKNTIDPFETAGDLMARAVKHAKEFKQTLRDLDVTANGYASY